MKKFWLVALAVPALLWSMTSANSNCEDMSFSDADVCISIEKESSNRFQVDADLSDTNGTVSLLCDVLLPNNNLVNVGACNGEFTYNGDDERTIKVYVRVNNQYKTLEAKYDFDEGERTDRIDDNDHNNNNNSSNGDLDDFDIRVSPSTPESDEWADVTLEAVDSDGDTIDDYDGTVTITVQYRDGITWRDLSDSKFDIRNISIDSNDEYDFDDSDNGEANFEIKFDDEDEYRIVVEDEDENVEANKTFTVDDNGSSNNNNGDLDNFVVTASDTTPSTSQRVDLTVKARDDSDDVITDFDGSIDYKVYYRSSNSSTWTLTTSSTYYEVDSDFDDGYDFRSSDHGIAELDNFIKFKKNNYDYKVRIFDQDDSSVYKEITFNVGSSSNNSNHSNGDLDDFDIRLSPSTPESNEWTDVTIEAVDSDGDLVNGYDGTVSIVFQYKDGSTWRDLGFGGYDIRDISLDSNDEYDFEDSDDSKIQFEVKFEDEDDYRIVVEDNDENVEANKTFTVDDNGSSNSSSDGDFDIRISPTSPEEDDDIDVTIKALDSNGDIDTSYNDMVRFVVQKKSGSSWVTANSNDYDLSRTSYTFTSSDDGEKVFNNLLTFNNEGTYRLKVYQSNDTSMIWYKQIVVDNNGSSSSSNGFTSSERSQIRAIYNLRPDLIDELEADTPSLRNNTSRQHDQEDLYDEMGNIAGNDDSIYDNYDDFFDAFMDRYSHTLTLTH